MPFTSSEDEKSPKLNIEEWLASRKDEGLKIDPETAEVIMCWMPLYNPYGVRPGLPEGWPEELTDVDRTYFARVPAGDWIRFEDLPTTTMSVLKKKMKNGAYDKLEPCSNNSDSFDKLMARLKSATEALADVAKALADWHRGLPRILTDQRPQVVRHGDH
jgi:hypothetical protein